MNKMKITVAVLAAVLSGSVFAGDTKGADPSKAQYDAERARCTSGTTGQDQASCLKSTGAAYDSQKAGKLKDPNTDYRDNAMRRCAALAGADRTDCESRVDGQGTTSGSVKDGGIVKETITRNVNPSNTAITNAPPTPR